MATGLRHWRRPLRDGGVEFFFADGESKLSGAVTPASVADDLQRAFEEANNVRLPEPEEKAPRYAVEPKFTES